MFRHDDVSEDPPPGNVSLRARSAVTLDDRDVARYQQWPARINLTPSARGFVADTFADRWS
jgi:hypothetical protein